MKADLTPQRTLHFPHSRQKLNTTIIEVFGQHTLVPKSNYLHITTNRILMLITEPYGIRILNFGQVLTHSGPLFSFPKCALNMDDNIYKIKRQNI